MTGKPGNISQNHSSSFSALEKLWFYSSLWSVWNISAFKSCLSGLNTSRLLAICPVKRVFTCLCVWDGTAFWWLCDFSYEITWLTPTLLTEIYLLQKVHRAEWGFLRLSSHASVFSYLGEYFVSLWLRHSVPKSGYQILIFINNLNNRKGN